MEQISRIGLIILAAGESVRFGKPKQLLKFKGETLVRRIARESLASGCRPIIVVLGAEIEKSSEELKDLDVLIAENTNWQTGMSGSIKTGLEKILEIKNSVDAVILTVCDQPFVTRDIINQLIEIFRKTKAPIVASVYQNTLGVPALFSKKFFPQLNELKGRGGAKEIIKQFQAETTTILFPAGAFDIDTPEDSAKFRLQSYFE